MNRRQFLPGFAAVAVIPFMPRWMLPERRVILHADGVHDDSEALQAWIDGKEMYDANGTRVGTVISGKTLLINQSIFMRSKEYRLITQCFLRINLKGRGGIFFNERENNAWIKYCVIDEGGSPGPSRR
jgi:hypothetical protein